MVRLWYPAAPSHRPPAGYLTPGVASVYAAALNAASGAEHPADLLTFPTHSRLDAPAAGTRRPVLLFSHGQGVSAALYTGLLEELGSHGYVVAGIDHTFAAGAVEFPDGRVEIEKPDLDVDEQPRAICTADTRFVLDALTALAAGRNPDADHRRLPRGLAGVLDPTRIGAFGHSLGSLTVVDAIDHDSRIDAGAILDGNPLGPASLTRPVLMMGNPDHLRATDPDWASFYDRLRGPRLHMVIEGTAHADLSDLTVFKSAVDISALFRTGPIDGVRALTIQRTYLTAWFDHTLRGRPSPLLRGETRRFPEVDVQP